MQRGTIVDKLKEEVVRDVEHLRQVIKICEGTHFAYTISIFLNLQTQNSLLKLDLGTMHTPCETLPSKASLWAIAAQRQVGETSLNDMSSRSHQIIRLVSSYSPSSMMHTGLVENNGLCKFL